MLIDVNHLGSKTIKRKSNYLKTSNFFLHFLQFRHEGVKPNKIYFNVY